MNTFGRILLSPLILALYLLPVVVVSGILRGLGDSPIPLLSFVFNLGALATLVAGWIWALQRTAAWLRSRSSNSNPEDPPNEYVPTDEPDVDEAGLDRVFRTLLSEGGVKPDSTCKCYVQQAGDRQETMNYVECAVGVYHRAKVVRLVIGDLSRPEANFDAHFEDHPFSDIKKVILRRRTTPLLRAPRRGRDGQYPAYPYYFQTRIYTPTKASYAPKGVESLWRLLPGRYVFDWLHENTSADCATDTQESPLDGYPEGV